MMMKTPTMVLQYVKNDDEKNTNWIVDDNEDSSGLHEFQYETFSTEHSSC